ncbi:phage tail protein [Corynebacterium mastitidis]|uniref:Phage tail protein n=1 Tax=Corynebacterium mastitidis TaxID=161890 RepID=A0ABU8P0Y3_9CORY
MSESYSQDFAARMETIWQAALRHREAREAYRRQKPFVRLWDGDWVLRGRVAGEIEASFSFKLNDVGSGLVVLPATHHLAVWALDVWGRKTENIHVTADFRGARWGGRMQSVSLVKGSDGARTVEIQFLHDLKELDHVLCWPNPFLPAGVQWPKHFVLAGPSRYMLKLILFLNLIRLHGNFWQLPDDPLDPRTWFEGVTPWNWSIAVAPGSLLMDDSQWCILSSRMNTWREVAEPILEDAGLMVECRRWLEGDEKPKGWIGPLRNGQLIVDVVDKSGVFETTSFGGTIFGGMLRTSTRLADNLVDDLITVVASPPEPAEYSVSKWLGTKPAQPWVVYRDGQYSPIDSAKWTHEPATATSIVAGGKSTFGVNESVSLSVQLVGNVLSAIFFMPTLGTIADTALKPLYEDIFLAWGAIKSPVRTAKAGWSHYHESRAEGGESAWSLSGVVAMREGFWQTRSRTKHEVSVGDAGPYLPGDRGQGHFWLGDRIGIQMQGVPGGRVVVEQVQEISMGWGRDAAPAFQLTVGDPRVDQSPMARALDQSKRFFGILHDIGVM